ncbi:MAG TPA: hypothetical protein VEQ41_06195 [Solirubrobacterales bacterium]|nr:hypothetical protein [Solirubrobacterales bacterium]
MKRSTAKKAWLVALGVALTALALPGVAGAEVLNRTQPGDVTIPLAGGNGSPYPSVLQVEEADGNINDLNVQVTLSHTYPDDVDLALVSPDGDSEMLMSDACGSGDLAGATIEFNDDIGGPMPDAGPCATNTYNPSNYEGADTFGAPGPGSVSTASLANFDGEDPNGPWHLFVIDDVGAEDAGLITSWSLSINTDTAEVIVPGTGTSGKAKAYPSTKAFNTPAGKVVSDVNFTTPDFNHMHPDDVDMLLAGPRRGAKALFMSDACGSTDIHDYSWTFDDDLGAPMSDSEITGCNPFTIKPTNFGSPDTFPAPAPAGPYGTSFTAFDGLEGGVFSLFVNDDAGGDTGFLTSWSLTVTTRDAADTVFSTASAQANEGATVLLEVKRSGPTPALLGPATLAVTTKLGTAAANDFSGPTTLEFARGQAAATLAFPIVADRAGEGAETFEVTLASPRDDARLTGTKTATVVINPSAAIVDPPSNKFNFGKLKRNAKKGTAMLFVNVPGPGNLAVSGKKVKAAKKAAGNGGLVALPIKPKGKAKGALKEKGSVKFSVKVTFTPTGGTALTLPRRVKLVLND